MINKKRISKRLFVISNRMNHKSTKEGCNACEIENLAHLISGSVGSNKRKINKQEIQSRLETLTKKAEAKNKKFIPQLQSLIEDIKNSRGKTRPLSADDYTYWNTSVSATFFTT